MLLDNVVFTRGAAAHLPDKPLIVFYDTHEWKGGDGILFCRHHTAENFTYIIEKLVLGPAIGTRLVDYSPRPFTERRLIVMHVL